MSACNFVRSCKFDSYPFFFQLVKVSFNKHIRVAYLLKTLILVWYFFKLIEMLMLFKVFLIKLWLAFKDFEFKKLLKYFFYMMTKITLSCWNLQKKHLISLNKFFIVTRNLCFTLLLSARKFQIIHPNI